MAREPKKETDRVWCLNFMEEVPVVIEAENTTCLGCGEDEEAILKVHGGRRVISCFKYGDLAQTGE